METEARESEKGNAEIAELVLRNLATRGALSTHCVQTIVANRSHEGIKTPTASMLAKHLGNKVCFIRTDQLDVRFRFVFKILSELNIVLPLTSGNKRLREHISIIS